MSGTPGRQHVRHTDRARGLYMAAQWLIREMIREGRLEAHRSCLTLHTPTGLPLLAVLVRERDVAVVDQVWDYAREEYLDVSKLIIHALQRQVDELKRLDRKDGLWKRLRADGQRPRRRGEQPTTP